MEDWPALHEYLAYFLDVRELPDIMRDISLLRTALRVKSWTFPAGVFMSVANRGREAGMHEKADDFCSRHKRQQVILQAACLQDLMLTVASVEDNVNLRHLLISTKGLDLDNRAAFAPPYTAAYPDTWAIMPASVLSRSTNIGTQAAREQDERHSRFHIQVRPYIMPTCQENWPRWHPPNKFDLGQLLGVDVQSCVKTSYSQC